MIGQIGTAKAATTFLEGVGNNKEIEDMVFVTSGKPQPALAALHGPDMSNTYLLTKLIPDQLDERLSAFKQKEGDLDRWVSWTRDFSFLCLRIRLSSQLMETLFMPIKN